MVKERAGVAVPVPLDVPTVTFATVNCVELAVATGTFVRFSDEPEAMPRPVMLTKLPATSEFAQVYVTVVPLPEAAVTE